MKLKFHRTEVVELEFPDTMTARYVEMAVTDFGAGSAVQHAIREQGAVPARGPWRLAGECESMLAPEPAPEPKPRKRRAA